MGKDQDSLIGRRIDSFDVLGNEHDSQGRWVGADVTLRIPPVGRFFLNVVTRHQLQDETVRGVVEFGDDLDPAMFGPQPDSKDSYVVNDSELSDRVLKRVLGGKVGPDMVESLWYGGPIDDVNGDPNLNKAA